MTNHPQAFMVDMDDTLFPEYAYVESGYRAVAESSSTFGISSEVLFSLLVYGHAKYGRFRIFNRIAESERLPDTWLKNAIECYRSQKPRLDFYPGVAKALSELRTLAPIAVITDGNRAMQRSKVEGLDLEGRVDTIIFTDEVGCPKPSPDAYLIAARIFGVKADACCVIGDDPLLDVPAAAAAGMACIRVRTGRFAHLSSAPTAFSIEEHATFVDAVNRLTRHEDSH